MTCSAWALRSQLTEAGGEIPHSGSRMARGGQGHMTLTSCDAAM